MLNMITTSTVPTLPYSIVYKTYEPMPDDITEKDLVYVVREVLPPLTETVELVGYAFKKMKIFKY